MIQKDYLKKSDQLYDLIEKTHDKKIDLWLENVVFTWHWWLGVALTVLPWMLWVFLRKKDSTHRILYAGFFSMFISSWFDYIGVSLGLWHYNYDVVPMVPSYLPWDFALIPITIMFMIQFKPHFNPYIKSLIFAGGSAFIGEPIFKMLNTYDPEQWKYIYSFPILFVICLITQFITKRDEYNKL